MTVDGVADALEHSSGLLALAGTADMVTVEANAVRGDAQARLAIGVYVHRLRAGIAAMASAMNGVDLLVFTGGVGQNAGSIRSQAIEGLSFLGARIDRGANATGALDVDISSSDAIIRTVVVEAREDVQIAAEVRALLTNS